MKEIKISPPKKQPIRNTEEAISYAMTGLSRKIGTIREEGGDVLALQTITYIFSGNPVLIFTNDEFKIQALQVAESVRRWCLIKFREHGGLGPEVVDRIIGPERQQVLGAMQALERFAVFVDTAKKEVNRIQGVNDSFDSSKQERLSELITMSKSRQLTMSENMEFTGLKAEFDQVNPASE